MKARYISKPLLLACSLSACSTGSLPDGPPTSTADEPVINGTVVTPFGPNPAPAYTQAVLDLGGCTGTLVKPSWVLTALHCAIPVGFTLASRRVNSSVFRTVDAVVNPAPADISLLHLSQPFTDLPTVPYYGGTSPSLLNQTASVYGYGFRDSTRTPTGDPCDSTHLCAAGKACIPGGWCATVDSARTITTANLQLLNTIDGRYPYPDFFNVQPNAQGQLTVNGDSGGPWIFNGGIAAVTSYIALNHSLVWPTNIAFWRERLITPSRTKFTVADFNHDNISDYVVTTATGSTFFLGQANGVPLLTRTESSLTLDSTQFTPIDLNADGRSDLIVTTPSGSQLWYSVTANGDLLNESSVPDWTYGTVFTPGDFDGNGTMDFVVTTGAGSSWYYNGSMTPQVTRSDLTSGTSILTPGDFDHDGLTDLIVTTTGGTQWLYANPQRTWNALGPAQTRTDLPMGDTVFTTGDFDGDLRTDVIITTPSGSYWYYSTPTRNSFNEAYVRRDLPLGTVQYKAGDFDGNGKTDLVITTTSGSYWYYSTGVGTWNDSAVPRRADLPLGNVMYTVWEHNGTLGNDLIITTELGSFFYDSNHMAWSNPFQTTAKL